MLVTHTEYHQDVFRVMRHAIQMHPRRDPAVGFLNVPRRGTFRSPQAGPALPPCRLGAAPTFWVLESKRTNGPGFDSGQGSGSGRNRSSQDPPGRVQEQLVTPLA